MPEDPFYELYSGVLMVREPGGYVHSDVEVTLTSLLKPYARQHKLGKIFSGSLGYVISRNPDTVLAPDASFIRQERLLYGSAAFKFFEGAPDLAVEVMSPSNRFTSMQRKAGLYLAAGTSIVWIIRPKDQTTVVMRKDGTMTLIPADGMLDGEDVIPGFSCSLASLFE